MNELFNFDIIPKEKRVPQIERKLEWLTEEILKDKSDMVDFLADFTARYINVRKKQGNVNILLIYRNVLKRLMNAHRVRDYRDYGVGDLAQ